MKKLSLPDKD